MKAIMYHYVQKYDPHFPNFRFLDFNNFIKQLDFFGDNNGFVTHDEWLTYINCGVMPEKKGKVVLTFDDGMVCQYKYVYPELIKRKLWGIFYVPSMPYLEKKILDVHKIHLLIGKSSGNELMKILSKILTEEMIPFKKRKEFREHTYIAQNEGNETSEFKRILNYYIGDKFRSEVINEILEKLNVNLNETEFYIPEINLKEMSDNGMIIGSHTNSHPVMSKLNYEEQKNELTVSFSFIKKIIDEKKLTYCHPYGGFHSFSKDTTSLLDELGAAYSFNVESREIDENDRLKNKHCLPRFDCNLFPYGKIT